MKVSPRNMDRRIIANIRVLEDEYIPSTLPCRDVQRKELVFSLSPFRSRKAPEDCLCYGKPGTGKTSLVKYVLEQLYENTKTITYFVNCWDSRTFNLVLDSILDQARLVVSEVSYYSKLSRLKQKIGNRYCVIALDEADRLKKKELNDTLYRLKGVGNVSIVCISNSRRYFLDLDPRVISRTRFNFIEFPLYSEEELLMILRHRVEDCNALVPGSYNLKTLEKIAEVSSGDARIAIQTLKRSASIAEIVGRTKIDTQDISSGNDQVKRLRLKYYLERLGPHHKLIIEILEQHERISSKKIFKLYSIKANEMGLKVKSSRTLNYYLKELTDLKYIEWDRLSTRGNVRMFKPAYPLI